MKNKKRNHYLIIGLILAIFSLSIAIVGFFYTPYDPNKLNVGRKFEPPSLSHILGCDNLGRDILSRIMAGSKMTIMVGLSTVVIGLILGLIIGAFTGYYGGKIDKVLMRINDAMIAFPSVLLAIILVSLLGPGKYRIILILSIVFIPSYLRITRGEILKLKDKEFVELAKLIGVSNKRVIFVHILPNIIPTILSTAAIGFNNAILTEASLSFLGIGVMPPNPSLGRMLAESQAYIGIAPWYCIFTGLFIVLIILSFSMIGEGILRGKQSVKYKKSYSRILRYNRE